MAAVASIPADLITVMSDITDVTRRLRGLCHHGLAEQHDDRFGLPVCHAASYRDILFEDLQAGSQPPASSSAGSPPATWPAAPIPLGARRPRSP